MANFRSIDRDTGFLMPPSVNEWLPMQHLARFIVEVVESLDLRAIIGSYQGKGSAPYHPSMLLAMLLYGYAVVWLCDGGVLQPQAGTSDL